MVFPGQSGKASLNDVHFEVVRVWFIEPVGVGVCSSSL